MANNYLDYVNINGELVRVRDVEARTLIQTNSNSIASVTSTANKNTTDITVLKNKVSTAESNITNLQNEVAVNTSDIDNLGVDMVKAKTDISTLKLDAEQAKSDITSLDSRVDMNESYISSLQAKYDDLDADIGVINTDITSLKETEATQNSRLDVIEAKNTEQDNEITSLTDKNAEQDTAIEDLNRRLAVSTYEAGKGIFFGQGKDHTSINVEDELLAEIHQATTDIADIKPRLSKAESDISSLDTRLTDNEAKDEAQDQHFLVSDGRIETLENDMDAAEDRITSLETNVNNINGELPNIKADISNNTTRIDEIAADVATLESSVGTLTSAVDAIETKNNEQDSEIASIKSKDESQDSAISTLQTDMSTAKNDIVNLQNTTSDLTNSYNRLDGEVTSINNRLDNVESSISGLEFTKLQDNSGNVYQDLIIGNGLTVSNGVISAASSTLDSADILEIGISSGTHSIGIFNGPPPYDNIVQSISKRVANNEPIIVKINSYSSNDNYTTIAHVRDNYDVNVIALVIDIPSYYLYGITTDNGVGTCYSEFATLIVYVNVTENTITFPYSNYVAIRGQTFLSESGMLENVSGAFKWSNRPISDTDSRNIGLEAFFSNNTFIGGKEYQDRYPLVPKFDRDTTMASFTYLELSTNSVWKSNEFNPLEYNGDLSYTKIS